MVNLTILESIPLNNSIVQKGMNFLTTTAQTSADKVTNLITSNVSQSWMANIILLMIACSAIFVAGKITQKFAKIGLYILGIVLVIGLVLNFVS